MQQINRRNVLLLLIAVIILLAFVAYEGPPSVDDFPAGMDGASQQLSAVVTPTRGPIVTPTRYPVVTPTRYPLPPTATPTPNVCTYPRKPGCVIPTPCPHC